MKDQKCHCLFRLIKSQWSIVCGPDQTHRLLLLLLMLLLMLLLLLLLQEQCYKFEMKLVVLL